MLDLPPEIFKKTFQHLNKKALQTCCFVCKSWYMLAIPLNWKEVTLQNRNIALVKTLLTNYDNNQYFKYSRHTKTLAIIHSNDFRNQYKFSKLELLGLLNHLPNLNRIHLGQESNYFVDYLEFLLDADMPQIKNIDIGYYGDHSKDFHNLFFVVNYRFRDTITSVYLFYDKSIINFNSQHINILDSLAEFKKLTVLEIHNTVI
ncbi:hypothetical protein EDC94DRAFT_588921 [Helicostylum pulchrum]|nr:hypothetical protein EDC94DRAFT_588921 [Helicostylum pulchrum]